MAGRLDAKQTNEQPEAAVSEHDRVVGVDEDPAQTTRRQLGKRLPGRRAVERAPAVAGKASGPRITSRTAAVMMTLPKPSAERPIGSAIEVIRAGALTRDGESHARRRRQ
jgi:hypothetical protein